MNYLCGGIFLFVGLFLINVLFSYQNKHIDPAFETTLKYQIYAFPLFLIANMLIGYGIKFGFKAVHNLTFCFTDIERDGSNNCRINGLPFL